MIAGNYSVMQELSSEVISFRGSGGKKEKGWHIYHLNISE
jgi:hypothetical protein